MTSSSPLEALQLDIVKVSVRIDEVDQELTAAQQSGLAATDSYLRDTLLELRKEKNELRKEKNELRKQETILLQAKVPGASQNMIALQQQLTRIEAAVNQSYNTSLNTFHYMFAPSTSDLSQRSTSAKKLCTNTYDAHDRPEGRLWCMVLGLHLKDDLVRACHIYKRSWPAQCAAELKLEVDSTANMFPAQKAIERAFDRFRLVIVPNNLSEFTVHILDPSLGVEIISNTILSDSGAAIRFADIDGNQLQFVTEARPAKRAFAWHAEEALRFGRSAAWPAASLLTVPPNAWSSDTCDSSIRDRYFQDLLELQAAKVPHEDDGVHT